MPGLFFPDALFRAPFRAFFRAAACRAAPLFFPAARRLLRHAGPVSAHLSIFFAPGAKKADSAERFQPNFFIFVAQGDQP
jgi:hypothetical protein